MHSITYAALRGRRAASCRRPSTHRADLTTVLRHPPLLPRRRATRGDDHAVRVRRVERTQPWSAAHREGSRRDHARRPHSCRTRTRNVSRAAPHLFHSAPRGRHGARSVAGSSRSPARSRRRRSICIWPTVGLPVSTYVLLKPEMPRMRSAARWWRHDDAVDRATAFERPLGSASVTSDRWVRSRSPAVRRPLLQLCSRVLRVPQCRLGRQ